MEKKIKYKMGCLRWSGGKTRHCKFLDQFLIKDFSEYREPFVGGGSVFFHIRQYNPTAKYWINDKYTNLYLFWTAIRDNAQELRNRIWNLKTKYNTTAKGKDLFNLVREDIDKQDEMDRAVYFYILNKCSYAGLTESRSSYSPQAYEQNFSWKGIDYLVPVAEYLQGVKITNLDYSELLKNDGENVYIYADPPYDILNKKGTNALYGKDGEMHTSFDHNRFAEDIKNCTHDWMITYNCTDTLTERFADYRQLIWDAKYTMTWGKNDAGVNYAKVKKELLIMNYQRFTADNIDKEIKL